MTWTPDPPRHPGAPGSVGDKPDGSAADDTEADASTLDGAGPNTQGQSTQGHNSQGAGTRGAGTPDSGARDSGAAGSDIQETGTSATSPAGSAPSRPDASAPARPPGPDGPGLRPTGPSTSGQPGTTGTDAADTRVPGNGRPGTAQPERVSPAGASPGGHTPDTTAVRPMPTHAPASPPTPAHATRPAPQRPMTVSSRPPRKSGRRARLVVKRVDPWSTLKFSFAYSLAGLVVLLVAVIALYSIVDAMGVIDSIRNFLHSIGADGLTNWLSFGRVMLVAVVVGSVNVVLFTAFATLTAFVYNVCMDLVGGIEVTLADRT